MGIKELAESTRDFARQQMQDESSVFVIVIDEKQIYVTEMLNQKETKGDLALSAIKGIMAGLER